MTRCLERIFRGGAARLRHDVSDELPILQGCGDRRKVMLDVQDKLAILKLRAGCAVIGFEPVIEDALQGGTRSGDVEPERDDSSVAGKTGIPAAVEGISCGGGLRDGN
jgi:hypothetical protein